MDSYNKMKTVLTCVAVTPVSAELVVEEQLLYESDPPPPL